MSDKDWTGKQQSIFVTIGASNHTDQPREANDYYATDPKAIDSLVKNIDLPHVILEPACGEGHLSKRLEQLGHKVYSYDKIDRGYGGVQDFFFMEQLPEGVEAIVTNPPYKYATEFVLKSLELLPEDGLCCMFLKTQFLEGQSRFDKIYRNYPPLKVLQYIKRVMCARNGDFDNYSSSAIAFAWFVWQKGNYGKTVIEWI